MQFPLDSADNLVLDAVRHAVGTHTEPRLQRWYVCNDTYLVASVHTARPALKLVVKLEIPAKRPNRHLDVMARLAKLVRAQTSVPTSEVVALDTSGSQWPWNILIVTELAGDTWYSLYPRLDAHARAVAQRQIGRAAAQLNRLAFAGFGEFNAHGAVSEPRGSFTALQLRAARRIRTPRFRLRMQEALASHQSFFDDVANARLTHEDMNPFNLLFEMREAQPVLSGVLDFESAWAGVAESDLARLEFWHMTGGDAVRSGYAELTDVSSAYADRRPVLQLLWCLEYADEHPTAEHQAHTDRVCAELGIPPIALR